MSSGLFKVNNIVLQYFQFDYLDHYDRLPPPKNSPRELFIFHGYDTENLPHEGGIKERDTPEFKKKFKDKCCNRKHTFNCKQGMGVLFNGSLIFDKKNITIHGIYFTYKKNVSPYAYVYVTEYGEEALVYYNKFGGRFRGSFALNDGRSFAFHLCFIFCQRSKSINLGGIFKYYNIECQSDYVFYQFNQKYLRSKEKRNDVIIIDEANTKSLQYPILRKSENEYSIMFYYTWEFARTNHFKNIRWLLNDYFEELIHKTNLGYISSNIPMRARMHCFEKATIEENVSENMSVILDKFRKMKGTPENLRNFADVAVLIINDVKDSCGISYGHAYRNGWTFSVVSRDCAISQLTFSQGIAHNFGADHSSEYLFNKGDTQHVGRGGNSKHKFARTIMQSHQMKTRIGKIGMPAKFLYFSEHIDQISALGNESCVCYKAYNMKKTVLISHMGLEESCTFHLASMNRPGTKPAHNVLMFKIKDKFKKKNNDIRNQKDLYSNFLKERQNLFKKYLKSAQKLYETYLKDAHNKMHEHGYNYVHVLGSED